MTLDTIYLNKKMFDILSSDTRVALLKILDCRPMTVSELAGNLDLAKSTIHEHLARMEDAGLVVARENGNKWIYYALTRRGRSLLHPGEQTRFIILLVSSICSVCCGIAAIALYLKAFFGPRDITWYTDGPHHDLLFVIIGVVLLVLGLILGYVYMEGRWIKQKIIEPESSL